jgi:hypothetical protein
VSRNPYSIGTFKKAAKKKAETWGEPVAVVDDHKTEPEYVRLRKLPSFLMKHSHARVLCDGVYPQGVAS